MNELNNGNGMELSQESLKMVEAGNAAHQAMVELAEHRRQIILDMQTELKLVTMEVDRLRLDVFDLKERLATTIVENQKLDRTRTAYETFVVIMARQLTEFVPPQPPDYAHRRPDKEDPDPKPVVAPPETPRNGSVDPVARYATGGRVTDPRPPQAV